MNSQKVLILGSHAHRDLVQALASTGFIPQVWGSIRHSLDKLVRERFAAVVIDRKFTHADVLEYILNVRDIDKMIPVVVVGPGKDEQIERRIVNQDHTVVIAEFEGVETLGQKLTDVLKVNEDENV